MSTRKAAVSGIASIAPIMIPMSVVPHHGESSVSDAGDPADGRLARAHVSLRLATSQAGERIGGGRRGWQFVEHHHFWLLAQVYPQAS